MPSPRRIGIFDSGLGGLTVVRELLKRFPNVPFTYLGDTARVPYGNKSPEMICEYAKQDVAFLIKQGVTDIVVACNTMSAYALPTLQEEYPDVRFFDVISPVAKFAADLDVKLIGVIGTRATVKSDIYQKEIHARSPQKQILSVACPLFVPLVEEGWVKYPETKKIVRRSLFLLKQKQIQALILGCTHYPLLQKVIQASLQKRVKIIDAPAVLLDELERHVPELLATQGSAGDQEYFFTDISDRTREMTQKWLAQPVQLKKAILE